MMDLFWMIFEFVVNLFQSAIVLDDKSNFKGQENRKESKSSIYIICSSIIFGIIICKFYGAI